MVQRLREAVRAVVEPVIAAAGYDLEELAVQRVGRRHVVRVTVDGDDGVGSGAIGDLSRKISRSLDVAEESGGEIIPGEYVLEVSSPGVDRPLTEARHWRRNIGRLVKVRVGERQVTGRVAAADADGVVMEAGGDRVSAPYAELGPGRVQLDFSRLAEIEDAELDGEIDDEREDGP
jgi:ribosome maturation factor RimP